MLKKKLVHVALYAIAMAYLESTVVVYLRRIYGITDLLTSIHAFDRYISIIELGRELATLLMLFSIGLAVGKKLQSRIGTALYAFGIWDICYYVWLVVFIGFPRSLFDWDLLFLIPLPWWGPVIAPVIISLLMILGGARLVDLEDKGIMVRPTWKDWILIAIGVCDMLFVFMSDAISSLPASAETLSLITPKGAFLWIYFLFGYALAAYGLWRIVSKNSCARVHDRP